MNARREWCRIEAFSDGVLAFAVGLVTILVCWINHHNMFTHVRPTAD